MQGWPLNKGKKKSVFQTCSTGYAVLPLKRRYGMKGRRQAGMAAGSSVVIRCSQVSAASSALPETTRGIGLIRF